MTAKKKTTKSKSQKKTPAKAKKAKVAKKASKKKTSKTKTSKTQKNAASGIARSGAGSKKASAEKKSSKVKRLPFRNPRRLQLPLLRKGPGVKRKQCLSLYPKKQMSKNRSQNLPQPKSKNFLIKYTRCSRGIIPHNCRTQHALSLSKCFLRAAWKTRITLMQKKHLRIC